MSSLEYFTPATGLIGGCLIGLSAAILLIGNGDILGASGIASSLVVTPKETLMQSKNRWKLIFVGMFFLTSRVYITIWPDALADSRLGSPGIPYVSSAGTLVGGFLVGIGTRLGNGCTTGHGICGMARFSIRSFVGVGSFMLSGVVTASVCDSNGPLFKHFHFSEAEADASVYLPNRTSTIVSSIIGSLIIVAGILSFFYLHREPSESATEDEKHEQENDKKKVMPSILSGSLFSIGLVISQMTLFSKIYGFLNLNLIPEGTWDPTLLMVMGGGFFVSFLSYQFVKDFAVFKNSHSIECPLTQNAERGKFNIPKNRVIDANLIIGEVLFGIGWGTAGWCPGPAMWLAFAGYPYLLYRWWPMFFVGALIGEQIKTFQTSRLHCAKISASTDPEETKQVESDDSETFHNNISNVEKDRIASEDV